MPTVNNYLVYGETALAAYAKSLSPTTNNSNAYGDAGMATAQALRFDESWTVLTQSPDDLNGFSAVLLQNRSTGEKVLAIRGTEPSHGGVDYITDIVDIAALGHVERMAQYQALETFYAQLISSGMLTSTEQVVVTGHSLGGFLAEAFTARHPDVVSSAYTYNAPGFGGAMTQLLEILGITDASATNDKIINVRATDGVSATAGLGQVLGSVQQVRIEAGTLNPVYYHSIATLTDTLSVYRAFAELQPALTVDQIGNLFAGSGTGARKLENAIDALRDVLLGPNAGGADRTATGDKESLFNNLYALTSSSAFQSIAGKVRLNASSKDLGAKARNDFSALASLVALSPVVFTGTDAAGKDQLETVLQSAWGQNYIDWQTDKTMSLADRQAGKETFTDLWIADRCTLLEAIVSRNLKNGTSTAYSNALPSDRAYELRWVDAQGIEQILFAENTARQGGVLQPVPMQLIAFGGVGADTLAGSESIKLGDHLYGGASDDTLSGLGGDDYLQGDKGDDSLDGGAGNDTLVGGVGTDTYTFTGTWGRDTLRDADGLGLLKIEGITLEGTNAQLQGESAIDATHSIKVWTESVTGIGDISYRYNSATRMLDVLTANGQISIANYSLGQLGLTLPVEAEPVEVPIAAGTLDFAQANDYVSRNLGAHLGNDLFVNAAQASPDWPTSHLTVVDAWSGDDVIEGGAAAASQAVALRGAAGEDQIFAGTRQTLAQALADSALQEAAANGGVAATSFYLLDGGAQDDQLIGSSQDDALFGGDGDDTVVGGAGGDIILSDGDSGVLQPVGIDFDAASWRWVAGSNDTANLQAGELALPQYVGELTARYPGGFQSESIVVGRLQTNVLADVDFTALAVTAGVSEAAALGEGVVAPDGSTYEFDGRVLLDMWPEAGMVAEPTRFATARHAGADTVYAGAGDDVVNAGGGSDLVFAGADNDFVVGYDGNDIIYGEAGRDVVFGDFQVTAGAPPPASFLGLAYKNVNALDASRHGNDFIDGGAGNDLLVGNGGDDEIAGADGDDELYGDELYLSHYETTSVSGDDVLHGGEGDDKLYGGRGRDILTGGADTDLLQGQEGDDTYFMDGLDTALDAGGTNRYVIDASTGSVAQIEDIGGAGSRVEISNLAGTDLKPVLHLAGEHEVLRIGAFTVQSKGWQDGSLASLSINGIAYSADWLLDHSPTPRNLNLNGTGEFARTGAADDWITVNGTGNQISAGAGHDQIYINAAGNQVLLQEGDSQDYLHLNPALADNPALVTLTLAQGLSLSSVRLEFWPSANSFVKVHFGTSGSDALSLFMDGHDMETLMERVIVSAGGQTATLLNLLDRGQALQGSDGSDDVRAFPRPSLLLGGADRDILRGSAYDDILDGGTGDDGMYGGGGDDTYRWGIGFGSDQIIDGSGFDTLEVLNALPAQLRARSIFGTLELVADNGQVLRLESNADGSDVLDRVKFTDGTIWDAATLREQALVSADSGEAIGGSAGNDHLRGSAGNDFLSGEDGDDWLEGGAGDDQLSGGSGNNVLDGGPGDDSFSPSFNQQGQTSNDTYIVGDGHDYIWETEGSNLVKLTPGWTPENIVVHGYKNLYLTKGDQDSVDIYRLFYWWSGGFRSEEFSWSLEFSDGTAWSIDDIEARALVSTGGDDNIFGFETNDVLTGAGGNDSLSGRDGEDTLDGGAGDDTLDGGYQNDIYLFGLGDGRDEIVAERYGEADRINTLRFKPGVVAEAVTVMRINATDIEFQVGTGSDRVIVRTFYGSEQLGAQISPLQRVEFADGTVWDLAKISRLASGMGSAPAIASPLGDLNYHEGDSIDFVVPESTFSDSDAGDTLTYTATLSDGAALPPWLSFDAATRRFSGMAGASAIGTVSVQVTATDSSGDAVSDLFDLVISIEDKTLIGTASHDVLVALSGNDILRGDEGSDHLYGNAGDDLLDGGTGDDTMTGGTGNDVYAVDSELDSAIEIQGEGVDTVQASISYALDAEFENLTLTGSAPIDGIGNALGNVLTGNGASNILDGGAGADILIGGAGDDTYKVDEVGDLVVEADGAGVDTVVSTISYALGANLDGLTLIGTDAVEGIGNQLANSLVGNGAANRLDGGAGADAMFGGFGDDSYVVDDAGDRTVESAGAGLDHVASSVSYALSNFVENLTLVGSGAINAVGNELNNVLVGNGANNVLDGGIGVDSMAGGAGNDTYIVDATGDLVFEAADSGLDLVESSATFTLAAHTENLRLSGASAINATGNSLDNSLIGNGAANMLFGGYGNDSLDGQGGADRMVGGAGDDAYYVDNVADVVTEFFGEGVDVVLASVSYALSANTETLHLTGTTAINGTGNAESNLLIGNSSVNRLDGGAGADSMAGGDGNDTYVVDDLGDVVTEVGGGGTDSVESSISYTLSTQVETLRLTGAGNTNGTGNALANSLAGNAAANRLDGSSGADAMTGGAGNDVYVVDNVGDTTIEAASGGTDTVEASLTWSLAAGVENLKLTGTASLNATGNNLTNVLTGNAGNNVLDGGAGDDLMFGGAGDDTYYVDRASDLVIEAANAGVDTVLSAVTYTLGANIENLRINAAGAVNATGNSADNVLFAGDGNNVLNGLGGTDTVSYLYADAAVTVSLASNGAQATRGSGRDTLRSIENLTGSNYGDTLRGSSADNLMQGGAGNDSLNGGAGSDTYMLGRGDGSDTISDNDAARGNSDIALFGADISIDQLWLRQVGNDMEVSVIGGSDKFTVDNWYLGRRYHVEQFKTSDGKVLLDSQVQNLVQAMASFSPPAAGQTTLPANYQSSLNTVIAANWH